MNSDDLNNDLNAVQPDDSTKPLPADSPDETSIGFETVAIPAGELNALPADEDITIDEAPEEEVPAASEMPIPPDEVGAEEEPAAREMPAAPRIVAEAPLGVTARPRPMNRSVLPEDPIPPGEPAAAMEQIDAPGAEEAPPAAEPLEMEEPASQTPAETTPSRPTQPLSRVTVGEAMAAAREDWQDDDLSPELAAVLFGTRKPTASAPGDTAAAPPSPEAQPAVIAETAAVEAEPPAEPIALTDITSARRLRLTAKGHSAAAPDAALQAKTRYVRIEEPLSGDRGQHTVESWTYFKPDYPSLEGRLVQRVRSEEITYADGSWEWHYERRYTDRGMDRRVVRASADRAYVERDDTVSRLEARTGKRMKVHEEAAMILAAPEQDEKRGFLGGLLGRDDDDDAGKGGRKTWREADSSDRRQARKQGGQAFPRRFLGIF